MNSQRMSSHPSSDFDLCEIAEEERGNGVDKGGTLQTHYEAVVTDISGRLMKLQEAFEDPLLEPLRKQVDSFIKTFETRKASIAKGNEARCLRIVADFIEALTKQLGCYNPITKALRECGFESIAERKTAQPDEAATGTLIVSLGQPPSPFHPLEGALKTLLDASLRGWGSGSERDSSESVASHDDGDGYVDEDFENRFGSREAAQEKVSAVCSHVRMNPAIFTSSLSPPKLQLAFVKKVGGHRCQGPGQCFFSSKAGSFVPCNSFFFFVPVPSVQGSTESTLDVKIPLGGQEVGILFASVRYRGVGWSEKREDDGCFDEVRVSVETDTPVVRLERLEGNTEYEIFVKLSGPLGDTVFSTAECKGRTDKAETAATKIANFFIGNATALQARSAGRQPWGYDDGDKSIFLGHKVTNECHTKDKKGAVEFVTVADEFMPEVRPSPLSDGKNSLVLLFTGATGHGKSTQLNAFCSFLLQGAIDDDHRLMLIDDRGHSGVHSVTKKITVFCIRPISPVLRGKTLYIVDTPGFYDTTGIEQDRRTGEMMRILFEKVSFFNAISIVCKANETRQNVLSVVTTMIFELVHKEVRSCLRTLLTFSDYGEPLARNTLNELSWPVEKGVFQVNNSAFGAHKTKVNANTRRWWNLSMDCQRELLDHLTIMPPVPSEKSAQVAQNRMRLNERSEVLVEAAFKASAVSRNILASIDTLGKVAGRAPTDKVEHVEYQTKKTSVKPGEYTTLCTICNFTCHAVCAYANDEEKKNCCVMTKDGYCTVCPKKCFWDKHKNVQFLLVGEKVVTYVVAKSLLEKWGGDVANEEKSLLALIGDFEQQHKEVMRLVEEITKTQQEQHEMAMKSDPQLMARYLEVIVRDKEKQQCDAETLIQLKSVKRSLEMQAKLSEKGAAKPTNVVTDVFAAIRAEMNRRVSLTDEERASEEKSSTTLYSDLYDRLPRNIQKACPSVPKSFFSKPSYKDNLVAIIGMVRVLLKEYTLVDDAQH